MLSQMSVHQLHEWMAYYQLEPWGDEPNWARHGDLMALTYNVNRGKDTPPAKRSDFIPQD